MKISALQQARAAYQPKLPQALKGVVKISEGSATKSVADEEAISKMFPNTYGLPIVTFECGGEAVNYPAINVGVILSGGQAPGGHNVIAGLFDGIKYRTCFFFFRKKIRRVRASELINTLLHISDAKQIITIV